MADATLTAEQMWRDNRDPHADPTLLLIEMWEDHHATIHRYAACRDAVVSRGETYEAASIGFRRVGYGRRLGSTRITVSNINRRPGQAVIRARGDIYIRMIVINHATPDDYEEDTQDLFKLGSTNVGPETVEGTLVPAIDMGTPVPFKPTTAEEFRALFA